MQAIDSFQSELSAKIRFVQNHTGVSRNVLANRTTLTLEDWEDFTKCVKQTDGAVLDDLLKSLKLIQKESDGTDKC